MMTKRLSRIGFCSLLGLALGWLTGVPRASGANPPEGRIPPLVYILAPDPVASEEGPDPAMFVVFRLGPPSITNADLTVSYALGGTASNGEDYTELSGEITIPAGRWAARFSLDPIDDELIEGLEHAMVVLQQPLQWPPPYIVAWPSFAVAHIEDNDREPVNRPPFVQLVSPPDGATFTGPADVPMVARAWDVDGRVETVAFYADGVLLGVVTNRPPRPIELAEADSELAAETDPELYPDLDLNADVLPIPRGLFRFLWEDAPPGDHVLTAVATDNDGASTRSEPVTIKVTEPPPQPIVNILALDPVAAEPDPDGTRLNTATFLVTRTGSTELPLTVYYQIRGTAENGVDYSEIPNTVVIPEGSRAARIVIEPIDDPLVEGTETVVLQVVPPVCIEIWPPPPDCYLVGRSDVARAIILDNDTPPNQPPFVSLIRPQNGDVFRAPADITLVAAARDLDGRVVSVEFFEGANSLGIVSNLLDTASVVLSASDLTHPRPPFVMVWSNVPPGDYVLTAKATDDRGASALSRPVKIKVLPHGLPPVVNVEATDPEAAEVLPPGRPNPAVFTVTRTGSVDESLVVFYRLSGSAQNGLDYNELSGRVLIPRGASSAEVVVEPIDDRLVEGDETVVLTLVPMRAVHETILPLGDYVVGPHAQARAVIHDNDLTPGNQRPKVALVRPEDGQLFPAFANIELIAEARDADGYVRSVEFFEGTNSLGVVFGPQPQNGVIDMLFRLTWSNVPPGSYVLTAVATDNRGAQGKSDPVHIRVLPPPPIPVVTIEATDPWATEGGIQIGPPGSLGPVAETDGDVTLGAPIRLDPAIFTVRRSGRTNMPLTVYYELGGTAENGVDYQELSGSITIPEGAYTAQIVVSPLEDNLTEPTETVIAALRPVRCESTTERGCYIVGDPSEAIAYIRDNDLNVLPHVEIVQPTEGQTFPAEADIEIGVSARDPDGWVGLVEFFANGEKIGEDSIIFVRPPPPGQEQKFSMVWSNVPPGAYTLTVRATDNRGGRSMSRPVQMRVAEPCTVPVVSIAAIDRFASEQNPLLDIVPDTATFRVTRTCRFDLPLVVNYRISGTAENGVDYVELPGYVVIPAGEKSADIVIDVIDDLLVEGTETVILTLVAPDCLAVVPPPPNCYAVGREARDIAYIRDDDVEPGNEPPRVALVAPPNGAEFEAPVDIRLVASASDPDGWVEQVEFFANGESLGVVKNHPWILDPARDPQARAEVDPALVAGEAAALEPHQTAIPIPIHPFWMVWSNVPPGDYELTAVATDNRGASTTSDPVKITVNEPVHQPIVTIKATDPRATEGCPDPNADCIDPATFTVQRTGSTELPLTVYYRISGTAENGVDYDEIPNTVVIPAGQASADILVMPIDDELVEGRETVVLTLVAPPCIDIYPPPPDCYLVGRCRQARAVIYDNDAPGNQPPMVKLLQPEDGAVFLAPATVHLVAAARDLDGTVVQVEFFEGDNSLGVVPNGPSNLDGLFKLTWENVPAGHYVLTAVATDDQGETAISEPVEIKVVPVHRPPIVTLHVVDPEAAEPDPGPLPVIDTATFEVRRTGPTDSPLTVYYRIGGTAENGVDYHEIAHHVVIPAGASSAPILIAPIDDSECEGRESVILALVPPPAVSTMPPPPDWYRVGEPSQGRAVIRDNDVCPPNQPPRVELVQPQDGDVFRAPTDILLVAAAKDPDGRVVRVDFYANHTHIGSGELNDGLEHEFYRFLWRHVAPGAYTLTATATDDQGATSTSQPVHIRVLGVEARPVVQIRASDPFGSEGEPSGTAPDQAVFTVWRNCCTNIDLHVRYELSGTAENGVDYRRLSGEVTIPAGAYAARIIVQPIDDNLAEGTETVVARVLPPICIAIYPPPPDCYLVGHRDRDVAFIRDNDTIPNLPPNIAILIPSEGEQFVAPADIRITAVGFDRDGWIRRVQFFEGDNEIGRVDVPEPPSNTEAGGLQTFTIHWNDVPAGRYTLTARATDNLGATTDSGPIHIAVRSPHEMPVVTVVATDPLATEPPANTPIPDVDTATFSVRRSSGLDRDLTVFYRLEGTARNGRDYRELSGQVVIPAGAETAEVPVIPLADNLVEGLETVVLVLVQPDCTAVDPPTLNCYLVGEPGRALALIRDAVNVPPRVRIVKPEDGQQFRAPADIPIEVKAVDPDGWVGKVEFYANDEKIGEQEIFFIIPPPPGQMQTFSMVWSNVTAGHYVLRAVAFDDGGAHMRSAPIEIDVVGLPPRPVVSIVALDPIAREGAHDPAVFRVRRTGPTNEMLMVWYSIHGTAENGVDYKELDGTVVIPAGRHSAPIVIEPVDDTEREPIETVILRLEPSPVVGPIDPYVIGRPRQAGAVILDNDQPVRLHSLIQKMPDGRFLVNFEATPGETYRIESSTDLVHWEPLANTAVESDTLGYVDPDEPVTPYRFYRAVPEVPVPESE